MSRIDDALTRVTGEPEATPKPSFIQRFISERHAGHAGTVGRDHRHYPSVSSAARAAMDARIRGARPTSVPFNAQADFDPTENIFALRHLVHYAGFMGRAVRRHKVLVAFSFVLTFTMVVVATALAPRSYEIEVTMLTQRSAVMQSLSNPGRAVPYDEDAPTKAAAEIVLRRDNVISLIRQTDLIRDWDRTRAPILRFYDDWKAKILGRQPTLDDKLDALVEQIEGNMVVSTAGTKDGVVTINLLWPDPQTGFLLVQAAQQTFLDARQLAETQLIGEVITILERSSERLNKDLQLTLSELTRTHGRVLGELAASRPRSQSSPLVTQLLLSVGGFAGDDSLAEVLVDPRGLTGPKLGRLKTTIAQKRVELMRLEAEQKGKLESLQAQLSVARTIYTQNHPTVQSLQQNVTALQHGSPQIRMLHSELDRLEGEADDQAALAAEQLLQGEISKRGSTPRPRPRPAALAEVADVPVTPEPANDLTGRPRPDTVAEFATLSLRTQLSQLRAILERTDSARIELEVAKAAFKHRYSTVSPASEPSKQSFPDTRRVIAAGFLASVLFGLFTAIAADVLSNRLLEPWQVQRQLGLSLLGKAPLS